MEIIWFFPISALINALTSTILGLFLLAKNSRAKVNRYFFYFCMSVATWSYCYLLWQLADNANDALFWSRGLMFGAIFTSLSYFHLVIVFLNKENKYKIFLRFFYCLAFLWVILNFTPYFVNNIEARGLFRFWPTPGPFYAPYLLTFFFHVIYASYLLFKEIKKSVGIYRIQTTLMLVGLFTAFVGGSTNYFLWYKIPIDPWGNILVTAYVILTAYSIFKYRFLKIKIVIKRSIIFIILVLIFTAIFVTGAVLVTRLFEEPFKGGFLVIGSAIISIIISLTFQPLKNFLQNTTDAFLFVKEYEPQKFLSEMGDLLSETLDPKKLYEIIATKLESIFHYQSMNILLLEASTKQYQSIHSFGGTGKLTNNLAVVSPLIKYLHQGRKIMVSEELLRQFSQTTNDSKLPAYLRAIQDSQASVIAPLFSKQILIGLMLLGEKKSGDIYTSEDLNVLEIVANQAATAIVNAQLYEEMRQFNVKLKEEVDKATADLRQANIDLRKLDEAKSEFISIASHQLRTPLTIIKGYISMMLEGSFGKLTEVERCSLDKVYASNERLIKLVDDLLNISRIESGRLEYNFESADLDEIVYNLVEQFKPVAKKKKIYLDYIRPEKPLNKVKIDLVKIKEVVSNLIDNAIKYTKRGGVRVMLKEEKNQIEFSVADTGEGMSREEIKNLFKKFVRGPGKSLLHTEGSGLGLYVAHKLLEAHQSQIKGESQGKGKGSRFAFSLPVVKK